MMKSSNKMIAAAAMASFMVAPAVMADGSDLNSWAQDAGVSVDKVMKYPKLAAHSAGSGSSVFQVTVDREGEVVGSQKMSARGSSLLTRAARRVVTSADFPALPDSYQGDSLTFELQLNYAVVAPGEERRFRAGKVTSRRIAESGAPVSASLRIVSAAE